jgi:hypothetical protein
MFDDHIISRAFNNFLLACALFMVCGWGRAEAEIVPKSKELFFNEVVEGEVVEREIELVNTSSSTINVTEVIPDCGCLVLDFKPTPINPGESFKVVVKFFSRGFSGPINKVIRFITSLSSQPKVDIPVRGRVLPRLVIRPERLVFPDQIASNNSTEQVIKIRAGTSRLSSLKVRSLSSNISISKVKLHKDDTEQEYRVRLLSPLPLGDFNTSLSVRVDGFNTIIQVFARILGAIELDRSVLPFGLVQKGQIYTKKVNIRTLEKGLVLTSDAIVSSCDCIKTNLKRVNSDQYLLNVNLDTALLTRKRTLETIKIYINEEVVELRVSALL